MFVLNFYTTYTQNEGEIHSITEMLLNSNLNFLFFISFVCAFFYIRFILQTY